MMLADSDVLIDFLRGKGPGTERIALEVGTGRLHTTTINAFELLSGATNSKDKAKVATLLAALVVLPLDLAASEHAARVRRELERKGNGIGTADYLIAGVCLAQNAVLITGNTKHFDRVPGLKLSGRYP
jgi:tRNA(fMet)-specific endonuclease VapC